MADPSTNADETPVSETAAAPPLLTRDRQLTARGRLVMIMAVCLLALLSWTGGLLWFVQTMPLAAATGPDTEMTDAIVVLTGGSNRLQTGIDLLQQGRGSKLFVTGVYQGVEVDELLRLARNAPGELECCIELDYQALDTVENASETARWMNEQGYRTMRLVTSDYHMRRSLLEFAMADPSMVITPHPITPKDQPLSGWWQRPESLRLYSTEYTKFLVTWLRYRLYRLLN